MGSTGFRECRCSNRSALAGVVVVALALVALSIWDASANAYVYWSNFSTGTVGRANLDGSSVDQGFISGAGTPSGIAVDSQYIYWANGNSIGRARLDGTGVEPGFVNGGSNVTDVAVDGNFIYWTQFSPGLIGRANLDGSGVNPSFIDVFDSGGANPSSLAVDAGYVYWTNAQPGSVGRSEIDGENPVGVWAGSGYLVGAVAVNGSHVYFRTQGNNQPAFLFRAGIDGTGGAALPLTAIDGLSRLEVGTTHLYWGDYLNGTIGRSNLDGTGIESQFITGASQPFGVAVDYVPTGDPSPSSVTFGIPDAIAPGVQTPARSVTLSNKGGTALEVSGLTITGPGAGAFSAQIGTCGAPVPPGGTCTLEVRFQSPTKGYRYATLEATSNSPTDPRIPLTGRAGDSVAPKTKIVKGPAARSRDRSPTFRFRSNEKGSTFVCRIDRQPFSRCRALQTFRVRPGRHLLRVAAKDASGNFDPTPARRSFTVLR